MDKLIKLNNGQDHKATNDCINTVHKIVRKL